MATAEFHARIDRINKAAAKPVSKAKAAAPVKQNRQEKTVGGKVHMFASTLGAGLGLLIAIMLQGAVRAESPWGPGTALGEIFGLIGFGGLMLILPLVLISLFFRKTKPGFFQFSLSYAAAVIVLILI